MWDAYGEITQSEFCRRIHRTPQYVANRRKTLELPDDLLPIAAAHEGVMTQLIAISETHGELRERLKSGFDLEGRKRLSVKAVRDEIEHDRRERAQSRQSQSYAAPDRETQQRQSRADEQGSAPLSRGLQVTGHSSKEASDAAQGAVLQAHSNLETARQWIERGGKIPRSELLTLKARVEALLEDIS